MVWDCFSAMMWTGRHTGVHLYICDRSRTIVCVEGVDFEFIWFFLWNVWILVLFPSVWFLVWLPAVGRLLPDCQRLCLVSLWVSVNVSFVTSLSCLFFSLFLPVLSARHLPDFFPPAFWTLENRMFIIPPSRSPSFRLNSPWQLMHNSALRL